MPRAIRIHTPGGPEAMKWEEVAVGDPGQGEARIRHSAVGVNYIDTYHRSGLYKGPLPSGLGSEGAGVVEAVGTGVDWVKPGDRVAYCGGPLGSYSESRVMPAERLVKLPDGSGLWMTWARYLSPTGVVIHGTGLIPSVEVEEPDVEFGDAPKTDPILDKALEQVTQKAAA